MNTISRFLFFSIELLTPIFAYAENKTQKFGKFEVFMYKNEEYNRPINIFSPWDKISLKIKFFDLQKGNYEIRIHWYNPKNELQEANTHHFVLQKKSPYTVEACLTLEGHQSLLDYDFDMKFFGKWQVKVYLNYEKIVINEFRVQED
jgi:hypothetical protein